MQQDFGARRIVVGAHYGLHDWLMQRVSAVLLAMFAFAVVVQMLMPGAIGYTRWVGIFSAPLMKALTLVAVLALHWHAWVGMRDIWMDYVKSIGIKLMLQVLTLSWLVGCAGWALQVLWRL